MKYYYTEDPIVFDAAEEPFYPSEILLNFLGVMDSAHDFINGNKDMPEEGKISDEVDPAAYDGSHDAVRSSMKVKSEL